MHTHTQRYSRQHNLPQIGLLGQQKLQQAKVLCIGAGGLGAPILYYLAAAGIGTLGIVDHDRIELSNLQRQILYTEADVGDYKAFAARQHLLALNSEITIHVYAEKFTADNAQDLCQDYDVIVDGCDNFATHYLVNDHCVALKKPLVYASIFQFQGQIGAALPGKACYRCLFPQPPKKPVATCAQAGVLGVLPGIVGSLQAAEVIKIIVGIGDILQNQLLTVDALGMHFQKLHLTCNPDCPHYALHQEKIHEEKTMPNIPQIRVRELKDYFSHSASSCHPDSAQNQDDAQNQDNAQTQNQQPTRNKTLLIDVRESHEYAAQHIDGSINFPLSSLSSAELPFTKDQTLLLICQAGVRSQAAAEWLQAQGYINVVNVADGMAAFNEKA